MKLAIKLFILFGLVSTGAIADEISDLKSLGSNRALIKRAQKLDPKNRYRIVQKRLVDRNLRFEFSAGTNIVAGGDAYFDTINAGGQIDFHINPKWSVGVRYYKSNNTLTQEGERVHLQAEEAFNRGETGSFPDVDPPESSILGTINFYPVYGKLNFFNLKTIQFDVYTVLGAGTINLLQSGRSFTYTAGLGTGIWFTNRITTRFEIRYQGYQDTLNDPQNDPRQMNIVNAGVSIGFLL